MINLFENFTTTSDNEWKQKVNAELKGGDYIETLVWESLEGIQVKPLYQKTDVQSSVFASNSTAWKIVASYYPNSNIPYAQLDGVAIHSAKHEYKPLAGQTVFTVPGERENFSENELIDWDFLANLATQGNWENNSKEATLKKATLLLNSNAQKALSIDTGIYQNAGANMVEQLALMLLEAKEYSELLGDKVGDKLYVKMAVGYNFFFEIAKLRAARILWNNLAQAYQNKKPLYLYAYSSLRNKSVKDKYNNIIRSTYEATAGIFGNANAVEVSPYDAIFKNQTAFASELAFKQQWVLREESYLGNFSDPLSGSYFVENLTRQLATKAWDLFKKWEEAGGFIKGLENGFIISKIKDSAAKEQALFDENKINLIGVNKFPNEKDQVVKDKIKETASTPTQTLFNPIKAQRLSESIELK